MYLFLGFPASNIPCLNDLTNHTGAPIIRDEAKIDGAGCPIQMGTANSIQDNKKQILALEKQSQSYQKQYSALNDLISLFIQTTR